MPFQPLSPVREACIAALYAIPGPERRGRHLLVQDIARMYHVHPNTVRNVARRHGLPKRRGPSWRERTDA